MGAWGALIMSFFGALFVSMTFYWQWHLGGVVLALPFVGFAVIALAAWWAIRLPGEGITPTESVSKAILWSSAGEGIGLFAASNIVINLHRPEWLMPAMALVVGLHFLPIAKVAAFRPFWVLGGGLIVAAVVGFALAAPAGGVVAGLAAAGCLWVAAGMAVLRDWKTKRAG